MGERQEPLYSYVARLANGWNTKGNIGLVVGATYPDEAREIRAICPDLPILMPGVGAQAGDLEAAVQAGIDGNGANLIVNASRGGIIDEAALAHALRDGRIAGAGIDVFVSEPPKDDALTSAPNIQVTPHLGASTDEAQEKAGVAVAPGVGFGEYGEGYVRVGLLENEHRIRQAARNVKKFLANADEILARSHNALAAQ